MKVKLQYDSPIIILSKIIAIIFDTFYHTLIANEYKIILLQFCVADKFELWTNYCKNNNPKQTQEII